MIKKIIEHEIPKDVERSIVQLRKICFENIESRSYSKQIPHFRFLYFKNNKLIGHIAIDHRVISCEENVYSVFGLLDICVDPLFRNKGVATELLNEISKVAFKQNIDMLLLSSDAVELYSKNGFKFINAYFSWLRIHEHKSCGVNFEYIKNDSMVKMISSKAPPEDHIDFLGYKY